MYVILPSSLKKGMKQTYGRIFSHVQPLYERAVSDLDP